eukprot:570559-Pleurochrysis_carterae.AAC.1
MYPTVHAMQVSRHASIHVEFNKTRRASELSVSGAARVPVVAPRHVLRDGAPHDRRLLVKGVCTHCLAATRQSSSAASFADRSRIAFALCPNLTAVNLRSNFL